MNALETSFASCRSWQDSTTQEWSSSLPSEDYTFCVGAAHDTAERNPRGKTDLCKPSHASCTRQEGVTLGWTSCPPKACSSHFGAPFSTGAFLCQLGSSGGKAFPRRDLAHFWRAQLPFWHSLTFSTAAGVACPGNVGHAPGFPPTVHTETVCSRAG
ncbi:hypothetical protein WJX77_006850 [Trebouxia sp. C0004]